MEIVLIFHTFILFTLSITAFIIFIVHITNLSLHRYSSVLFFTNATGFFHVLFLALCFLKLEWHLTVISPAVIDIYTIPTSCFIVIVVLVLTALSDIPQMYLTCSRLFNGIYVAVSIFVIHKMHAVLPLCNDGNFIDLNLHLGALGDWEIPKKLYFCDHFSSEFRGIFMEYILIYIPVTVVFSVRNRKVTNLFDDKMYRKKTCQQCHLNHHICKNIVLCLLVTIWIVRPIALIVLNSSHGDVIPLISVFCVFVYVLVHYMQSIVNVMCHRVKAVHIVKQTSKEIVYDI